MKVLRTVAQPAEVVLDMHKDGHDMLLVPAKFPIHVLVVIEGLYINANIFVSFSVFVFIEGIGSLWSNFAQSDQFLCYYQVKFVYSADEFNHGMAKCVGHLHLQVEKSGWSDSKVFANLNVH